LDEYVRGLPAQERLHNGQGAARAAMGARGRPRGAQARLDGKPDGMQLRRETVEHPFGTIKAWMGATHFKMKTLQHVGTEMALHVLAYNVKRVIAILGVRGP
jgi:hypothetical protein